MDIHHLVTMANQIAEFFKTSNPDRAEAVTATATICVTSGIRGCAAKLSRTWLAMAARV